VNYDPSPHGFNKSRDRRTSVRFPGSTFRNLKSHVFRTNCFFATVCFGVAASWFVGQPKSLFAQDSATISPQQAGEQNASQDHPPSIATQPTATTSAEQAQDAGPEEKKEKKGHCGSPILAPLPVVSPAIGSGIIPVAAYIFPLIKSDTVSPPSTIGGFGLITNNGTRAWGLGAQLFLKQDTYEVTAGYVNGNLNYSLYGVGIDAGNAGLQLPLKQDGHAFFVELVRRVVGSFFIGPRFLDAGSFLTVRPSSGPTPPLPPDVGIHTALRSLGLRVVRDTRSNHFYPLTGSKVDFTADFFAQALGSKYSFQRYKFDYDKFLSLGKSQVLAYDLYVCDTGGDPPFYAACIYGTAAELRGYTAGRYIDHHMFATPLEYRLSLPWRFGAAGFAGIGEVFPGATQILRINQFLPAFGGGPRFELSNKYHVNLRTDFARGKNSWTWSMGVGEAF